MDDADTPVQARLHQPSDTPLIGSLVMISWRTRPSDTIGPFIYIGVGGAPGPGWVYGNSMLWHTAITLDIMVQADPQGRTVRPHQGPVFNAREFDPIDVRAWPIDGVIVMPVIERVDVPVGIAHDPATGLSDA